MIPISSAVERSTIRKVSIRLVPFLALMFFINFLDRTAISFAGPNGMNRDLGLTAAQFGFAAGVFFFGYILLEIPSNLALYKFGARRWLARIMVTWGIVSLLLTWVSSATELYWLRLLLGVAEAGFVPGVLLYLSMWVPARYRSQVMALFYIAQPVTLVIGGPVEAMLINNHGAFGLAGWRVMYLGVAVPAIVLGVVAWFFLVDKPADARWLTAPEREWLTTELGKEEGTKATSRNVFSIKALLNRKIWKLALIYFGVAYGIYALAFFLPTIISGFESHYGTKFSLLQQGVITAVPYVPSAIALFFLGLYAARLDLRAWHVGLLLVASAASFALALHMNSPVATIAVITIPACAIYCMMPIFWSIPSRFLSGATAAAGIALINTMGNAAGFVAPYVTGALKDATGSYNVPMLMVGGVMMVSGLIAFNLGRQLKGTSIQVAVPAV